MGPRRSCLRTICLLLASLLLSGCAGLYFRDVETPPSAPVRHRLAAWPYQEYWTGIIFNGEKIGLTHLAIRTSAESGAAYELRAEALLAFHFLGLSKRVTLKAQDWVTEELRLVRFVHEYDLDGQSMKLTGTVQDAQLVVDRETAGRRSRETIPLSEPIYPTSAIVLYPTVQGLAVGRDFAYQVYDGQRQELARVTQTIEGYQESDLYDGRAFKVPTSAGGQESTLWINDRGEPVLEMAWHGMLISTRESERRAKGYLAQASVNKRDVLVEFSRVRPNVALPQPKAVTMMQVLLRDLPPDFVVPSDRLQQCHPRDGSGGPEVECRIEAARVSDIAAAASASPPPVPSNADLRKYLNPSPAIHSNDPDTHRRARDIVAPGRDPLQQISRLVDWIQREVEQQPVDVFSSSDVLEKRKAECQGLTWLYAAFARTLGIPTRVTNGLVYSEELNGFLYHTWAESWVGGRWLPVDPTFGQVGVDATHIKLLDGDRLADLLPLVDLVGKIRIEIVAVSPL